MAKLVVGKCPALSFLVFNDFDLLDRLQWIELNSPVFNQPAQKAPHGFQIIIDRFGGQFLILPPPYLERISRYFFDGVPLAIFNQLAYTKFQVGQILFRFATPPHITKKIVQMIRQFALGCVSGHFWQNQSVPLEKFFFAQFVPALFRASLIGCFERNIRNFLVLGLLAEFPTPNP